MPLSRLAGSFQADFAPRRTTHRFVLAHLTQLVLALDAIAAKNTIQVVRFSFPPSVAAKLLTRPVGESGTDDYALQILQVALIVFNTLFLIYAMIQVRLSRDGRGRD